MLKDPVAGRYWERLLHYFPQYQLALLDEQDQVVAEGNTIPLTWNGMVQWCGRPSLRCLVDEPISPKRRKTHGIH